MDFAINNETANQTWEKMALHDDQVLMTWARGRLSSELSRSSLSSLSSHESGGGGGKLKPSFKDMKGGMNCRSVPVSLNQSLRRSARIKIPRRSSLLHGYNHTSLSSTSIKRPPVDRSTSSNKNEEWGSLRDGDTRRKKNIFLNDPKQRTIFDPKPKSCMKSCMECTGRIQKQIKVTFSETPACCGASHPHDVLWYTLSDNDRFLHDASARGEVISRLMKYASTTDSSYNSSIGLVSAHFLKDYLMIPEEIIGIEHVLAGQSTARPALKKFHKISLMEEQQRQKIEGNNDPGLLAERLENYSAYSAHMARERAAYTFSLD